MGLVEDERFDSDLAEFSDNAFAPGEFPRGSAGAGLGFLGAFGVTVAGAARWLPQYGFGVVTEIEHAEAYAPLRSLRWLLGGALWLAALAAGIGLFALLDNAHLRDQVLAVRQMGQYTLGELIGKGYGTFLKKRGVDVVALAPGRNNVPWKHYELQQRQIASAYLREIAESNPNHGNFIISKLHIGA